MRCGVRIQWSTPEFCVLRFARHVRYRVRGIERYLQLAATSIQEGLEESLGTLPLRHGELCVREAEHAAPWQQEC